MGKTSLLVRSLSVAMDQGKRCALIDFQMLGQESLSDSGTFFRRLARAVAEVLDLPPDCAVLGLEPVGLSEPEPVHGEEGLAGLGRFNGPGD